MRKERFIMHKKEVLEIRKQYKPEECSITRICGCYVNGDKEIVAQLYNNVAKELGWKLIEAKDAAQQSSAKQILSRLKRERLNHQNSLLTHP